MKSEDKKRSTTCCQRTASAAPGSSDAGSGSLVVKADNRPAMPGRGQRGRSLGVTPPRFSPLAPQEILIDVDTGEDGMAFRFTWR